MKPLARIDVDETGPLVLARLDGEVDASNATWTRSRLRSLISNRSAGLAVDLTDTTYLDSAGIALLFGLAADLRSHQQQLHLVLGPDSLIARMLELTGLAAAVPTHRTVAEAQAAA
jgi:anti-anti-sigma factor